MLTTDLPSLELELQEFSILLYQLFLFSFATYRYKNKFRKTTVLLWNRALPADRLVPSYAKRSERQENGRSIYFSRRNVGKFRCSSFVIKFLCPFCFYFIANWFLYQMCEEITSNYIFANRVTFEGRSVLRNHHGVSFLSDRIFVPRPTVFFQNLQGCTFPKRTLQVLISPENPANETQCMHEGVSHSNPFLAQPKSVPLSAEYQHHVFIQFTSLPFTLCTLNIGRRLKRK